MFTSLTTVVKVVKNHHAFPYVNFYFHICLYSSSVAHIHINSAVSERLYYNNKNLCGGKIEMEPSEIISTSKKKTFLQLFHVCSGFIVHLARTHNYGDYPLLLSPPSYASLNFFLSLIENRKIIIVIIIIERKTASLLYRSPIRVIALFTHYFFLCSHWEK